MRISDLQNKNVINMTDGKDIGTIIDIEIDESGKTINLFVEKHKFILSSITNNKEISIKWEQIEKIGEDVILVRFDY
jgi:YlmC/YmxH family sporulation protein